MKIKWMEPYRVSVAAGFQLLKDLGLLSLGAWMWITGITMLLTWCIVLVMLYRNPGIALPWLRIVLTPLCGPLVFLPLALPLVLPPIFIVVDGTHIASEGFTGVRIEAKNIRRLSFVEDEGRLWLKVEYVNTRDMSHTRSFAVSSKVDREELARVVAELGRRASELAVSGETGSMSEG